MNALKQLEKRYDKPTPLFIKKLADSLLLVGGAITTLGIAQGNDIMSYISLGCMVLGKFLSNWFVK